MDTNKKFHFQSLKGVEYFSEIFSPIKKKTENHHSINSDVHKKHSDEKNNSPKRHHKRRLSPDIKKMKKMSSKYNNYNSPKRNHHQHHHNHKSSKETDNIKEQNQLYDRYHYKSQDKPIKMNLVSRKFKIADDFDEKNSNQFLKEKDECLREVILSDEIEEEKINNYLTINDKKSMIGSINDLSPINQVVDYSLNSKKINKKNKKNQKGDSTNFLFELINDLK